MGAVQNLSQKFHTLHAKMNGVAEGASKNITKILQKMTRTHREWHEKLPFTLLVY